mmetsp:Transcript_41381/g.86863  ORF Transcript_41381/g.86863 Transcript_41381/m.86863 type:complete len:88 (-) Transcript_41381:47-310(-)
MLRYIYFSGELYNIRFRKRTGQSLESSGDISQLTILSSPNFMCTMMVFTTIYFLGNKMLDTTMVHANNVDYYNTISFANRKKAKNRY